MAEDSEPNGESVSVSMELTGEYEDVMSKLQAGGGGRTELEPLVADVELLLETVVRMDGGTRSAIAQQLPGETTADFGPQAVVDTLQVLERYGLVVLEGNTWKPGPRLGE